jgi:hypothetical protein
MADFGALNTTDPVVNAESQAPTVIAICITFALLSAVAIALRLYTRISILGQAGADDVTIVVAEVSAFCSVLLGKKKGG